MSECLKPVYCNRDCISESYTDKEARFTEHQAYYHGRCYAKIPGKPPVEKWSCMDGCRKYDPNRIEPEHPHADNVKPVNKIKDSCYYEEGKNVNGCAWLTRELDCKCGNPSKCSGKKPEGTYHVENGELQKVELPNISEVKVYDDHGNELKKPDSLPISEQTCDGLVNGRATQCDNAKNPLRAG